jgi:hypothetical protein
LSRAGIDVRKELTKRRNSGRIVPRQPLGERAGVAMSGGMESASMEIHTRGGGNKKFPPLRQNQDMISHP